MTSLSTNEAKAMEKNRYEKSHLEHKINKLNIEFEQTSHNIKDAVTLIGRQTNSLKITTGFSHVTKKKKSISNLKSKSHFNSILNFN